MRADDEVRNLTRPELDTMLDWAAREGWNPGLHDAGACHAADPDAYLGIDVDGELAVTLSVVHYDDTFAFLGFYICRPELRGRGLGLELFEAGLARARATTIGLDGVLEQEDNYERDGFVTAHHSVRYGGTPVIPPAAGDTDDMRVLGADDVPALLAFEHEQHVFPAPRRAFLDRWVTAPGSTACAVGDRDHVVGYGVVRPCRDGHKVGPLFCPDLETARQLLRVLLAHVGDGPVFLDVPVPNENGSALARELGLAPVFETVRMYRGPAPDLDLDRVFGVTTFELG